MLVNIDIVPNSSTGRLTTAISKTEARTAYPLYISCDGPDQVAVNAHFEMRTTWSHANAHDMETRRNRLRSTQFWITWVRCVVILVEFDARRIQKYANATDVILNLHMVAKTVTRIVQRVDAKFNVPTIATYQFHSSVVEFHHICVLGDTQRVEQAHARLRAIFIMIFYEEELFVLMADDRKT